ncbi:SDR family oxidoreductase [Streptomyces sp. E11-3]|uniref:SDR family oxidoreductase n=1 Tax=Streptomyces sp. E11-3 TaxID=3110112 RepID=UPI00397FC459
MEGTAGHGDDTEPGTPVPHPSQEFPVSLPHPEQSHATPDHTTDNPRVAIVTGASRGIGRQTVDRLAADGFAVVIGYAGNRDLAEAAVKDVTATGGRAVAVQADVADEQAVAELFATAESEYGGVDVVVHAAGRMHLAPIADLDLAELDALHRTNIRGTFVVAQQAARKVRPGGAIVTFSTSVVGLAFPGYGAYSASKGAVEAVTLILAREMRGRDVTVNTVAPGPTATDLFLEGKDEETVARLAAQPPLERLGAPADIAEVVAFLSSPAGHWVNGQVIRANGGII